MQHRVLHAAGLFLFLTAGFVTGATPDAAPGDVVRKTDHGFINWTTLTLHSESSRIWDGRAGTALAARGPAYTALHRQTLALLHHTLFTLPVDGRTTLAGLSEETDEPGQTLENMVHERSFSWIPFHAKNGQVRMGLAFRLMGPRGVLTLLTNQYPIYELPPVPRAQVRAAFHHSGVVIDARHLPFVPALGTRIFNASGDLVYGIVHTDRVVFAALNHILFLSSPSDPRIKERAGERFALMVAKNTRGEKHTDLELFDADSDRILASTVTRDALRRCKVIILCKP